MVDTKTKKIFIARFVLAILMITVFAFMTWLILFFDDISTVKSIEIRDETKKGESFLFIKKDIENNKNSINKVYDYIIKADGAVDFMQNIENLAKSSGLKSEVKSVSFDPVSGVKLSGVESMRVRFDVIGEWKDVEYFLELLENYPMHLVINKIALNKFSDYLVKDKKIPQWLGSFEFSIIKVKDK